MSLQARALGRLDRVRKRYRLGRGRETRHRVKDPFRRKAKGIGRIVISRIRLKVARERSEEKAATVDDEESDSKAGTRTHIDARLSKKPH